MQNFSHHRPLRQRQIHTPPSNSRPRIPRRRHYLHRRLHNQLLRKRPPTTPPQPRRGLPILEPLPPPHCPRKHSPSPPTCPRNVPHRRHRTQPRPPPPLPTRKTCPQKTLRPIRRPKTKSRSHPRNRLQPQTPPPR